MVKAEQEHNTARSRAVRTAWVAAITAALVYIGFVLAAVTQAQ